MDGGGGGGCEWRRREGGGVVSSDAYPVVRGGIGIVFDVGFGGHRARFKFQGLGDLPFFSVNKPAQGAPVPPFF